MRFTTLVYAATLSSTAFAQQRGGGGGGQNNNNGGNNNNNQGGNQGGNQLALQQNLVQTGSQADGGNGGVANAGQALSKTSNNNFINFCAGKTLTNGKQIEGGSCNGIPMGEIPSKQNMISTIITFPETGGNVAADTTFDIKVQTQNLVAGSFTNAQETYYSAPQALQGGKIVGHTHVTVQSMGNTMNPKQPMNPAVFAFFKGINDAGNGNGALSATITGGLPAGTYRVCTMTSASNHQLVAMPVAQRGAQDDCTKFTVGGNGGGGNNGGAGGNQQGGNQQGGNQQGGNQQGGNQQGGGKQQGGGAQQGGRGGGRGQNGAAANNNAAASSSAASSSAAPVSTSAPAAASSSSAAKTRTRQGQGQGQQTQSAAAPTSTKAAPATSQTQKAGNNAPAASQTQKAGNNAPAATQAPATGNGQNQGGRQQGGGRFGGGPGGGRFGQRRARREFVV